MNYSSAVDLAGFQFNHYGCVEGTSGGAAADAGFTVSSSAAVVLGFSFTGSTVPAGTGITLIELDGNISEDCLSGFVFSDSSGATLTAGWDVNVCDDVDGDGVCDDVDDCVGALSLIHISEPTRPY